MGVLHPNVVQLLHLASDLYIPPIMLRPNPRSFDLNQILSLALRNNMLLHTARVIAKENPQHEDHVRPILVKGQQEIDSLRRAMDVAGGVLDEFVVFKTYRGDRFFRISNDIDVLVPMDRYEEACQRFLERGYNMIGNLPTEMSVGFVAEGMHKIHLHGQVAWCGSRFLDNEFALSNPRTVRYLDRDINIPGENADFLIHLAHCNYEPLHILLSEMLYLYSIYPRTDMDKMLPQATQYRWGKTFLRTVAILSTIHEDIFGTPLISGNTSLGALNIRINESSFPYTFSTGHLVRAVLEKRVFRYVATRAFKVISLLISKDSQRYIDPPERNAVN
jgi:hypothetical protein